ncbi:cytochrome c oxidase subunit II [Sinosporangium siamense]|uniref:cytochrome-c oxidase n=1 Tax=Sinosporangium siamense TaxID=1367973 RepID=A0A919V8K1_9ACTN|nr:cytochrome c oxidase subunit II [Sinosporangium siamense]
MLVASCSGRSPSTLSPAGPGARRVAGLWWLLFGISAVVSVVVTLLLLWAMIRRRGPGVVPHPGSGTRFVVSLGVIVPAIVLTFVYAIGLRDMRALEAPRGADSLVVEVTGHQWWWEVRYPAHGAVTANEIHIPAGRPVLLRLRTADVNHSFWVPQLMVKTDMIAGRTTQMWLQADRPGTYRGQCAEYCGLQHGRMAFHVVADPPAAFTSWLANQARPAAEPREAMAARGRQVIQSASCASCHTVRGTSAAGRRGPDLTHLASRRHLGAGTVPNTPGHLGGWIADSQAVKPGNQMPPQPLSPEDLRSLIAYLGTLR